MDLKSLHKSGSLSPSQALAAKKETVRRQHAFAELSSLLMSGRIEGAPVERLHKMIGGSVEELGHAELEMSLLKLTQMAARDNQRAMELIRSIRA